MTGFIILLFLLIIIILDLSKRADLLHKGLLIPYMLLVPHFPVVLFFLCMQWKSPTLLSRMSIVLSILGLVLFHFYSTLRMHLFPFQKDESKNTRMRMAYGGMLLAKAGIWGIFLQPFLYLVFYGILPPKYNVLHFFTGDSFGFWFDLIYTVLFILLFLCNGGLRMLCCCRRLGIVKRILICCNLWLPIVNLFLMHYMIRAVKDEYAITVERQANQTLRQSSFCCQTRYPLIMVHGIGFRDLKFFNYWGRIPRLLKENGAIVYYGHQKAWGTIEENGNAIAKTIDRALKETGAEKVNIIAHSKGGLDSRYAISTLGYADKIASLTTMSTPHQGSELINFLNKLPDGLYRSLAGLLDKSSKALGDKHPDCYSSSKQLAPAYCKQFNEANPDSPLVYYQSYASIMRNTGSDSLLCIPYFLMKCLTHEANDGLVTESSAKWGVFQGVLKGRTRRGVSHGDMIDLKREDIKGFDVIEEYVKIVEKLKEKHL